jgi:hypothetical protein
MTVDKALEVIPQGVIYEDLYEEAAETLAAEVRRLQGEDRIWDKHGLCEIVERAEKAEAGVRRLREENETLNEGLTASHMLGYGKAKEEYRGQIAEAVRECEKMTRGDLRYVEGETDKGEWNDALFYVAKAIRNRWPEYFKEDA